MQRCIVCKENDVDARTALRLCRRCGASYRARQLSDESGLITWASERARRHERLRARKRLHRALDAANDLPRAIENGLTCGTVDHHGELEFILTVDGKVGSVFLSREAWEAFGDCFGRSPAEGGQKDVVGEAEAILRIGGAGTRAELMFKGRRIVRALLNRIRDLESKLKLPSELQRPRDRGDA